MKFLLITFTLNFFPVVAFATENLEQLATTCKLCHTGPLSLNVHAHEKLAVTIKEIQIQARFHIPLQIDQLDDMEIKTLAKILSEKDQ